MFMALASSFDNSRLFMCSTFTVIETKWSENFTQPHEIMVQASMDNQVEDDDLPLAPWY